MAQPNQFFPSIGAIADQADKSEQRNVFTDADATTSGDGGPTEPVESLCMTCGEQVSSQTTPFADPTIHERSDAGNNPTPAHFYPFLS